jgi:trk system potassium uptake protein TrkA
MKIVIMGCGRVGAQLASLLSNAGHEISMLDVDGYSFRRLPANFTGTALLGDGTDEDALRKAGIEKADAFIAVTQGDNRNIMASQIAKHIFDVPRVICRIYDPLRQELYSELGIQALSPTTIFAQLLFDELNKKLRRLHQAGQQRMYIIIVGGGKVGYHLARALLNERHEVLVIEKDSARSAAIIDELGSICIRGDGCEAMTLASVGTSRADMFIAVTGDDEDNLVSCQVAKHKFKVGRVVARINNPKNETIFNRLGITDTINSTNIILEYIGAEMPTHPLSHLFSLRERGLEVVEVKIPASATTNGKPLRDINLPPGSFLTLIIRKETNPVVPSSNVVLQADDQIIAVTTAEAEKALRSALRGGQ